MKYFSHLASAARLINLYKGEIPFHHFIRNYFREHGKFGSSDRRNIGQLCYSYFRLGRALAGLPTEERILLGLLLCSTASNELLENLKPEWNQLAAKTLEEKFGFLAIDLHEFAAIFPFPHELSAGIDAREFAISHLIQPDLFIRVRPGRENQVREKLLNAGVKFTVHSDFCYALPNSTAIDKLISLDKEAVVQDFSSQLTGEFLFQLRDLWKGSKARVWDACSGSGGKSIMAYDILESMDLDVSDLRPAILKNLKKRFAIAGIRNYHSFVADLSTDSSRKSEPFQQSNPARGKSGKGPYDLVIVDAPCSGSGTWGRTPEQLSFFREEQIYSYHSLQKKIVSNVIPKIRKDGFLLYITCSVYRMENESMVDFLTHEYGMQVQKSELILGYRKKADTMFAAIFST
jgi:16S rRNA (cytosine967-C5)-methyltransferase